MEKKQEIIAIGVAKIIDLLKGGIKLEVRPPQASAQRKILVPTSNVKIEPKRRKLL